MARVSMRRAAAGFTLLEAIVAMVIFSMGAFALYGWLNANLMTLSRVAEARERAALTSSALDAVRRINPMEVPAGKREFDGLEIAWQAELVEPERNAVTQVGLPNLFVVGLYVMEVTVRRDGQEIDRFDVRQLGYRQERAMEVE